MTDAGGLPEEESKRVLSKSERLCTTLFFLTSGNGFVDLGGHIAQPGGLVFGPYQQSPSLRLLSAFILFQ